MKKLPQYTRKNSSYSWSEAWTQVQRLMVDAINRGDWDAEPCPHCEGTLIHSITINELKYAPYLHTCADCITWFDSEATREWVLGPTLFQQIGVPV